MQVAITGRHIEVTPAIRQYIEEKINRFEKYDQHLLDVHVILGFEKYRHWVEFAIVGKHLNLVVKEETEDMYASIDGAMDRVEKSLRRRHDRLTHHRPRPDRAVHKTASSDDEVDDEEDQ